jgi:hypothetical protein
MKTKFISCIILCIMIANLVLPRLAVDASDCQTIYQMVSRQPIINQFFSLSTLPVTIVSNFLFEQHSLTPELSRSQSQNNRKDAEKKQTPAPSDYSFGTTNKTVKCDTIRSFNTTAKCFLTVPAHASLSPGSPGALFRDHSPVTFICLMLCLLFSVRPRSAICDAFLLTNIVPLKPNLKIKLGFSFAQKINTTIFGGYRHA